MFHSFLITISLASGLLPATFAQSISDVCSNYTLLVESLSTLQQAQKCANVTGDLVIQYGSDLPDEIEFPLLEEVGRSFLSLDFDEVIMSSRIAAPNLRKIGADLYIAHWINLASIDMPVLDQASRFRLNDLPVLTNATFLSSIRVIENNFEIRNTSLRTVSNDKVEFAIFVEIFNNLYLEELELSALKNASYNIALRRNRPGMKVKLPALEEAWYLEFQEIESLEVPELQTVIGHFVVNSSSIETLSASKLKTIGVWFDPSISISDNKGLVITNNPNLDSISMPELTSARLDLVVRNNSNLGEVELPGLSHVTGNVALDGSFDTVYIPELSKVGGSFTIGTGASGFNCGPFQDLKNSGDIRGDYSCPRFVEPQSRAGDDEEEEQAEIDEYLTWVGPEGQSGSDTNGNGNGSGDENGNGYGGGNGNGSTAPPNGGALLRAPSLSEATAMLVIFALVLQLV